MTITLDILPMRTGGAAENMAADFLLLKRYPERGHARFRHYGWRSAAFTFGYSQKLEYVRSQLPPEEEGPFDLCRRATGGGVVDHREDWTYALVIPREHALCEVPAPESYRVVHECIADALAAMGENVVLKKEAAAEGEGLPTVCFERPERYDVIHLDTGAKIAGAAQKRAKEGMLFQGSIARATVSAELDWDAFKMEFIGRLAKAMCAEAVETPWPDFAEHEVDGLTEQYSSTEWNAFR
ncbi:lipoate-protein ligase A [Ereboglobus sp. PH5-5]|uniref:lipoyl protein ligase domain-containing protein n=1 Tax=unclassified Ereboglobus TaxID=2626932 RepID=UPI002406FCE8|nr:MULTISPECIES: lipoate--protein ligase family protein [unclassified Ereboglobus]MDF9828056.1 lipoate-protein ligase A [Ereboglobus sp. PH5-10]MDF9832250.1 lipoate-protein ligase A [Ereboglobus sp. PH5-5]